MLIQQGNVKVLNGKPWYAIELVTDLTTDEHIETMGEELVLSIVRWAARRKDPMQLLFPVSTRNLDGIKLLSPYLWMRSTSFGDIGDAINPHRGAVYFQKDQKGEPIPVEDAFIQQIIEKCRAIAEAWSNGIGAGSFVRVLYGNYRMFCGEVLKQQNGIAEVRITLRARRIKLVIPVCALENLGPERKEYFHS